MPLENGAFILENGAMSKFGTIALIVAGGTGTRFGVSCPKQYALLGGKPVISHSISAFLAHPGIDAVAVVIHPEHADFYQEAAQGLALLPPIKGGKERQDSVRLGLKALAQYAPRTILVHDAARPGVTHALIDRLLTARKSYDAVIPTVPVADTIKRTKADMVVETLERISLAAVQTPQCFDYKKLIELHENARQNHTDDAALFEAANLPVHTVRGEAGNLKITTLEDWDIMQQRLEAQLETRTGSGFDVHKFTSGDHIMVGGIKVPHTHGLEGHSDADVALHALVDALLGAASEGDIGQHFPPSDNQWKGADSAQFVTYTRDLIQAKGGVIVHVDITLICEKPKMGPHREAMRARIAELLAIDISRVSVKATTTEKLGFTGREEGIAAQALATVKLPPA